MQGPTQTVGSALEILHAPHQVTLHVEGAILQWEPDSLCSTPSSKRGRIESLLAYRDSSRWMPLWYSSSSIRAG